MGEDIEKFLDKQAPIIDAVIEKYIPRKFHKNSTAFISSPPKYGYDLTALDKAVTEPIWEFLDRGGKRWRPALFLLICEALGKNPKDFLDFAIIPEVIHNGTLMVDDIEDSSELRRGKPCTYRIFGVDIAINAGNAMYFLPLLAVIKNKNKLAKDRINRLYEIYIEEMINISFGQAMDIAWHRGMANADGITERHYLQMCAYKTGTLARMAARMAAMVAGADEDLTEKLGRFAEAIGIAFQMQDDVLDLTSNEFGEKKGAVGMDISEGKRTLMVIHTLEKANPKDKKRLIEILNAHTNSQKLRDEAIQIMKKYDSIEYTKQTARKLVKQSWSQVDKLMPPSDAKEKLRTFATYLVERKI
ncbi:MAG TPA: polyprenyl synthetase family protein [Candidatus Krumholzibacteriaceae bacterium]|nr:polyprenyl synthetase family protein [Candidatus Krumholzibacteriaceae bacterium]